MRGGKCDGGARRRWEEVEEVRKGEKEGEDATSEMGRGK